MVDEPEQQGGDPACWLDRVCPECGAFLEESSDHLCPAGGPDPGPSPAQD